MANKKKRQRKSFPPPTPQLEARSTQTGSDLRSGGKRWDLIALFFIVAIGGTYLAVWMNPRNQIPVFTWNKDTVKTYPHDKDAFTQGLLFHDGFLFESTGLEGRSSIRKVDPESGKVLEQHNLAEDLFGEGLVNFGNELIQLTWQNKTGIVYDMDLKEVRRFSYDHEGWGICTDGQKLIVSDGTSRLRFLDPDTFEEIGHLFVRRQDRRILGQLNELEYFGSKIYSNIYNSDKIYRIDAETGFVEAIIDLGGLWPFKDRPERGAVINGIAIKPDSNGKMWVTGKLCPHMYEIEIVPK